MEESDMGIGGFSFTFNRHEVVDFSVPFLEESTTILMPSPTQQRHLFACAQPFQLEVTMFRDYGLPLLINLLFFNAVLFFFKCACFCYL